MNFSRSRRRLLVSGLAAGGGLLLGYALLKPRDLIGDRHLLPVHAGETALNAWLRIAEDGRVTVAVPRAEMGQGVYTALAMLVAEELDVPWSAVAVEQAPIAKVYGNIAALVSSLPLADDDQGWLARSGRFALERMARVLGVQVTGGSTSVRDAWLPMRSAGATARMMLTAAAAARLGVPVDELHAADGKVTHHASARALSYGSLAAEAALLAVPSRVQFKSRAAYRYIGKPLPRLDLADKVSGAAQFGIDVIQENMLHAAIRIAPVFGGRLASVDRAALETSPGVQAVVTSDDAVVVVAHSWWHAERALQQCAPQFDDGAHGALSSETLFADYAHALDADDTFVYEDRGDARAQLAASHSVSAEFRVPPLAHACMEPMNCTARVDAQQAEIWCGNQAPDLFRLVAADALGLAQENVRLHTPLLGGGFGRRVEADVMLRALHVARALPGKTIKLIYSREQDLQHDTYRPPVLSRFSASLDERGRIRAWHNRIASPAVSQAVLARAFPRLPLGGPDRTNVEGAAWLAYRIPHRRVEHAACATLLPVGFWRSVGHSHHAFFTECFIDELARAATRDPFEFRLDHLPATSREHRVLALLRDAWSRPVPAGRARGVALHESFGTVVAQLAEVSLAGEEVQVHAVWCALDCGTVINPDIVIAQMESGIVFGLSAALYGDAGYSAGRIAQQNFFDHRLLRMAQMPKIEVLIIDSEDAPAGVGEPGTPPIAPAVANAVARLTGKPIRSLPIRVG
jgi:isoquinoline 1-oxidoreductase beta subunit